jgi:Alr-MurF fusion protein
VKLNYSLRELSTLAQASMQGACDDIKVYQVYIDTRIMHDGKHTLFACLDAKRQGTDFIPAAYALGCRAFLVPHSYTPQAVFADACFLQVENVLLSLQKIARAHRERFNYPVIGITGSFGKTMVKEWLYHFLQNDFHVVRSPKSYNSQIGVALSLLQMSGEHNLAIFEAGISQKGEMAALAQMIQPNIGVFTGIGNAHNAGFKSQQEKWLEKAQLFASCKKVISCDSNFAGVQNIHWNEITIESNGQTTHIKIPDYGSFEAPFVLKHKVENLKAILLLLKELDFPATKIQQRINTLPQIAMRMELVQGKNSTLIINDAYAMEGLDEALAYLKELAFGTLKIAFLGFTDDHYLCQYWFQEMLNNAQLDEVVLVSENGVLPSTISLQEATQKMQQITNAVLLVKGQHGSGIAKLIAPQIQRSHPTVLEINRQALRNNLTRFKQHLQAETQLMVMVKAAAYGVGATEMAGFLEREGIDYLGVAFPDEGVNLRKSGVQLPIMVMNSHQSAFLDVIENQLEPAIFSLEQLDEFTSELVRMGISNYPVHIKIETGMNRLGFRPEDIEALCVYLSSQPEVRVQSVYSHLAESGNSDRSFTHRQLALFNNAHTRLQEVLAYSVARHICNTDGIINYPEAHMSMVRLGIGLLGYAKLPELEHTLSLSTKISKVNHIQAGESLGYDRSFVADKAMEIAVLPIGYADGFRRVFGNGRGFVVVNEQQCAVLGNVCMDMCFVDVTGLNAAAGDLVELIGPNITTYDWASWASTIPYEIITSLSARLNRVWVD